MKAIGYARRAALWSIACGLVTFCSAQAQELKNINFLSVNESSCSNYPQFMMDAFGYLADEGYKRTFLSSDTSVAYVAFLANGDADITMLDAAEVLTARANNYPIKIVYEAYQYAPEGIVVLEDSPIQSLSELKGKKIGLAEQ
jgi:NitT/TauT family transport system substrate-binding protein